MQQNDSLVNGYPAPVATNRALRRFRLQCFSHAPGSLCCVLGNEDFDALLCAPSIKPATRTDGAIRRCTQQQASSRKTHLRSRLRLCIPLAAACCLLLLAAACCLLLAAACCCLLLLAAACCCCLLLLAAWCCCLVLLLGACAWCLCLVLVLGACAWCLCLVLGAWCLVPVPVPVVVLVVALAVLALVVWWC